MCARKCACRHYSLRTEKTYIEWIKRFILFHDSRHPSAMGCYENTTFLTWRATDRKVAASTQNQALAALLFLYKNGIKGARLRLFLVFEIISVNRPRQAESQGQTTVFRASSSTATTEAVAREEPRFSMRRQSESHWFPYTAEQMFDLAADIERYPEFLPHWPRATIRLREQDVLHVTPGDRPRPAALSL